MSNFSTPTELTSKNSVVLSVLKARLTLPYFLNQENKVFFGALWFFLGAVVYLASNHFHLYEPVLLPMSWIDQRVPFVPETVWIYTSEYWLFILVYTLCQNMLELNKYLCSFMGLQLVSAVIFILFPTTFPRELFPLLETTDAATNFLFSIVRSSDTPASCCPSLHVSSCYLSAFVFLHSDRKKFWICFLWATAVGVSTLTTKQHYVIDIVAGFALAVVIYWVFHHWFDYRLSGKNKLHPPQLSIKS